MPKFHFLVHYCNFNKEEWDQKEMEICKQKSEIEMRHLPVISTIVTNLGFGTLSILVRFSTFIKTI